MMTGNTAIHIASQLQSGAPRKAAFLVAVQTIKGTRWLMRPAMKAVHEFGLMILVFAPLPYVDASAASGEQD